MSLFEMTASGGAALETLLMVLGLSLLVLIIDRLFFQLAFEEE